MGAVHHQGGLISASHLGGRAERFSSGRTESRLDREARRPGTLEAGQHVQHRPCGTARAFAAVRRARRASGVCVCREGKKLHVRNDVLGNDWVFEGDDDETKRDTDARDPPRARRPAAREPGPATAASSPQPHAQRSEGSRASAPRARAARLRARPPFPSDHACPRRVRCPRPALTRLTEHLHLTSGDRGDGPRARRPTPMHRSRDPRPCRPDKHYFYTLTRRDVTDPIPFQI